MVFWTNGPGGIGILGPFCASNHLGMVNIAPIYGDLGDGVLIVLPTLSWFVVEPYPSEKSWSERCESQLG